MTAEDASRNIVVIDGFDRDIQAVEIVGEGMRSDEPLLFPRIYGEDDSVLKSIPAHDPGQLHHQGRAGGIIPDSKSIGGHGAETIVTAVDVPFHNNDGLIICLAAGQHGHDITVSCDEGHAIGTAYGRMRGWIVAEFQIRHLQSVATGFTVFQEFVVDPTAGCSDASCRRAGIGEHIPVLKASHFEE